MAGCDVTVWQDVMAQFEETYLQGKLVCRLRLNWALSSSLSLSLHLSFSFQHSPSSITSPVSFHPSISLPLHPSPPVHPGATRPSLGRPPFGLLGSERGGRMGESRRRGGGWGKGLRVWPWPAVTSTARWWSLDWDDGQAHWPNWLLWRTADRISGGGGGGWPPPHC